MDRLQQARTVLLALGLPLLLGLLLAGCAASVPKAGSQLQDCAQCPALVVIPPGEFLMGAPGGEEGRPEGPVHRVRIHKAFALGMVEVTQAQFAAFVSDTGHLMTGGCQVWRGGEWHTPPDADWTNPGYGRAPFDDEPVACVTWNDAQAYVQWLARRTGRHYRLPSEAEWEYAARAGGTADYYWVDQGADADTGACVYANVYDASGKRASGFSWKPFDCDDGYAQAAPVGRFLPNAFGLHDMIGNVWEWTADCYQAPYPPAPVDGSPVQAAQGDCERRAVRGGSWVTRPSRQRASFRGRDPVDARYSFFGFRVAADL
ncbi:MAG: formylglycine-generating enzyme family protein [Proteobacteria bacterium]|nr:MAG: formylglycine-generating enzyme family protein [Pseudomonadota bacterium]MCE7896713.1 formylglycine-generating enzyme family protein [Gammaproteobacteria bacterium PRO8]